MNTSGIVATKAERLAVGRCLRETIEPLYPEEIRKNLSAVEFLGKGIEKKYQEAQRNKETDVASTSTSEPNTINKEISTCLQNTSDALILYSRYMIYGYSLLDKQRDQHEKQTEESAPSVSLAQSQSEQHDQQHNNMALVPASSQSDATSGNEHSMAIVVANPQPAGSAPVQVADRSTQPETRSDPEQSMALVPFNPPPTGSVSSAGPPNTSKHYDGQNIWEPPRAEDCSEFARFALGLCNSNEFVNFNDLNEQIEEERIRRIGIVECSEECVQTFLNRIKNILTVQIHQIKEQPPKKEIEGEEIMSFLNNFVQLCKQNEFTNLKEIAEVGESWIGIYSGVYDTIYDIYANLPTKDALESMDRELATAFFDYESCIHWEAGLKTGYDEPLYDWLEKNALPPTKNKLARVLMQNPDELQSPPPESHPVDMVQILTDELGPGMVVANPAQPNNNDGQHESSHINYEGVPQFFQ